MQNPVWDNAKKEKGGRDLDSGPSVPDFSGMSL